MTLPSFLVLWMSMAGLHWVGPYLFVPNAVPSSQPIAWSDLRALVETANAPRMPVHPEIVDALVSKWAEQNPGKWIRQGKGHAPQTILAKLHMGQDIETVNKYLQKERPWSVSGSTWKGNEGDYDFSETLLTEILYLFGDKPDRLYPETVAHLLDTLLVEDGGAPKLKVPKTLGMVFDTENHLLMTESSRYLKNQWLRTHGRGDAQYDNAANGLQDWMVAHLNGLRVHGFHEFNSHPYQFYTCQALANIEAFAEPPEVAGLARVLLDGVARHTAAASLGYRQCTPFCRRWEFAGETRLDLMPFNDLVNTWRRTAGEAEDQVRGGSPALYAAVLPYRPPLDVLMDFQRKDKEYFVRFGHGVDASPEIYSAGPGWLLSAGGVHPPAYSEIIPRATTLLLDDDAANMNECFRILGNGARMHWNNTGVYRRFACGPGPVQVPKRYAPAASERGWAIYAPERPAGLRIAVYSGDAFGLIALFPDSTGDPAALLKTLRDRNPDPARIEQSFVWPDGTTLAYDVVAPAGAWVMTSAKGAGLDRNYDHWPLETRE
jgi:hypothetical protein